MKLRVKITKTGRARFISHLEYARTINRALRRAKLPVAYSSGFNPHIKMSLASALGVGIASESEYVEIELCEGISPQLAKEKLNQTLPAGLKVLDADVIERKADKKLMALVEGATYQIEVPCGKIDNMVKALEEYNGLPELKYMKKGSPKKKAKEVDLKFYVDFISYTVLNEGIRLCFDCKVTPTGTLKAQDILASLKEFFALDFDILACDIQRKALFRENKKDLLNSH